ncbi:PQQ-binding-like beta-propeller repeat protein [Amycolatopsis sp. Hca4]|uniref:outer membrane protein assembly factor BamB family protein n=1 Tax=Amycolatopsis sp. Hca4 TaxID=2742131 RepID=UPI0015924369|nr:PQQ-binding-like beta-propeller repeat protein [Amycolatopsis sp. Hca4]QKV80350.1 PQQ-binding-like beta-propeller repeat protein [Amycolatopsis sp. Hca4]
MPRSEHPARTRTWGAAVLAAVLAATLPASATADAPAPAGWPSAGQNNHNTRHAATERVLTPANVGRLKPRWVLTTAGDVSATPTVAGGVVYAPDWGGRLWAVDARTGTPVWSRTVAEYTGVAGDASRTSPAYWRGRLFLGTGLLSQGSAPTAGRGAQVVSVDARTGARGWAAVVDPDPAAIITGAPTVEDGVLYVGVSSKASITEAPMTFRGSVVALDANTGHLLWRTRTVPEGYTGGAVWGSQPVVDRRRGLVYVGTGQNYSVPAGVCESPTQSGCTPPSPDDHFDSILGLDLRTGALRWATPTLTADTWTIFQPDRGPDFDFGAGPNLYRTTIAGKSTELLGIGQKSGVYWAVDPVTGRVVWRTQAGPGGPLGGIQWGTSTDGKRIYAGIGNGNHLPWTLKASDGRTSTTTGGGFVALDAATGEIEWQVADPQASTGDWLDDAFVSSANGIVFAGSSTPNGPNMYALDAATGQVRWSFASGGSVFGGAAIADGSVFWGSGYYYANVCPAGCPGHNNKLYAFSLDGK